VPHGLLVTNPPYGVRLGEEAEVYATWKALGDVLRRRFLGWEGWLLAGDPQLAKKLGLRPKRRHPLRQGKLEARLLEVPIREQPVARDQEPSDG
jgi:23S rRNA G2445 N2-methylase RlmL